MKAPIVNLNNYFLVVLFLLVYQASRGQEVLPEKWWESQGINTRIYCKTYGLTFKYIETILDSLKESGYGSIEVFAPFEGDYNIYAGLPGINLFKCDPRLGTNEDFKNLVDACHERKMAIIIFHNLGYCSTQASFFQQACDDIKNGIESPETSWFIWSDSPDDRSQINPGDEFFLNQGKFVFSERAGKYFFSSWADQPQFNWGSESWREEAEEVIKFWMNFGIDGIVMDAVNFYLNASWEINNKSITGIINSYPNSFSKPEGAGGFNDTPEEWISQGKYTSVQDFSLQKWWETKSTICDAIAANNPSAIHNSIEKCRNKVVEAGGLTYMFPQWERQTITVPQRLLEIATIIGTGHFFSLHAGFEYNDGRLIINNSWQKNEKDQLIKIIRSYLDNPSLQSSSEKIKLSTNDDEKFYSLFSSSVGGDDPSLIVYNYQDKEETITVDLSDLDYSLYTPYDLLTEESLPALTNNYQITLPAFGYSFIKLGQNTLTVDNKLARVNNELNFRFRASAGMEHIKVTSNSSLEGAKIELRNYIGQEQVINPFFKSPQEIELRTPGLPKGMYFVTVQIGYNKIATDKVIVY